MATTCDSCLLIDSDGKCHGWRNGQQVKGGATCIGYSPPHRCECCAEYRMSLCDAKACLNQNSPRYQSYPRPDDTCENFTTRGTPVTEVRAEMRARIARSQP
jgi:hypothetical protein